MKIGVKEAAELLNVSSKTIYRWVADEKIPFARVGGQYRFSKGRLQEWLLHRSIGSYKAVELPDDESKDFTLVDCVRLGGIHYRVGGNDVPSALHEALALTPLPDGCNRSLLWELLLAREALCSTGVGHGIALAHPRQAALIDISRPIVSINFLENPTDFLAIDGQLVTIVILIVSPSVCSHLHIMRALSFALRQPDVFNLLKEQASRNTILQALAKCDRLLQPQNPRTGS